VLCLSKDKVNFGENGEGNNSTSEAKTKKLVFKYEELNEFRQWEAVWCRL